MEKIEFRYKFAMAKLDSQMDSKNNTLHQQSPKRSVHAIHV